MSTTFIWVFTIYHYHSTNLFVRLFGTVSYALVIMSITVIYMFHNFSSVYQSSDTNSGFDFVSILFCSLLEHFPIYLKWIQACIAWFSGISKIQRIFSFLFTTSALSIYYCFVYQSLALFSVHCCFHPIMFMLAILCIDLRRRPH